MSKGESFLNSLKRIGFPAAFQFKASDFDEFFSKKELLPLLECFASLTELNALTSEEVLKFQALTPTEIEEIDVLHKKNVLGDLQEIESKKREISFLEEHLSLIEKQNNALENQRELLKMCEAKCLEGNDYAEKKLVQAKQKFHTADMHAVSEAEKKLFTVMTSICEIVKELKSLMTSDLEDSMLPTTSAFKDQLNQFLEIEKKLFSHVKIYFQNNFQNQHESRALGFDSKLKTDIEEILFLKTRLKAAKLTKLKSVSKSKKLEAQMEYYKKCADDSYFQNFPNLHSQLKKLMEDANECEEKHQQKEKELYSYLSEAISDHIDAQCSEVALSNSQSSLQEFQYQNEKVLLPMNALLHQRIRLEQLIFTTSLYHNTLLDLEDLIGKTSNSLGEEVKFLHLRKEKYSLNLKEESVTPEYLPEDSIFLSLYKILVKTDELECLDVSHLTVSEVLTQIENLKSEKEKTVRFQNEYLLEIESAEKYKNSIEKFFSGEHKDFPSFQELKRNMNVDLNNLSLKFAGFQAKILEFQEFNQKKKLLDQKKNLSLQRELFVYALTDTERFEKSIEDIKKAMEKSEKIS